jgi:hypothetical protein
MDKGTGVGLATSFAPSLVVNIKAMLNFYEAFATHKNSRARRCFLNLIKHNVFNLPPP